MNLQFYIESRSYDQWYANEQNTLVRKEIDIDPFKNKIFTGDVCRYEDNKITHLHSCIRAISYMPGVLILENNKTYGNSGSKNKRYLYKCVPDDKRLPEFLVPYEIKSMGFNKLQKNKYITFKFTEWNSKHPIGTIIQTIGNVDVLEHFYEYQLYCKSLNASIQGFNRATMSALKVKPKEELIENIQTKYPEIENRTDRHIFTIDSASTSDYDDAMGIIEKDDMKIISIYISNVSIWMDMLNLWSSFSERISTIYLPDRKRPMMPTILSECLCSLQKGEIRFAFTMDVYIKDNKIVKTEFKNTSIKVTKNYCYEGKDLLRDKDYNKIYNLCKSIHKNHKYVQHIRNSHDLVSYLMILINYLSSTNMSVYNNGIYRSLNMNVQENLPETLDEEIYKFLKVWKNASGQYICGQKIESHDILELESYIHISSPIRRLVDLLNMIQFQKNENMLNMSEEALEFYNKWTKRMDYINTTMRSIRKIQTECTILELIQNNPNMENTVYNGYVFDKIVRNDTLYQYNTYIPELKIVSGIVCREDFDNYSKQSFHIFTFTHETKFKQKIRIQPILN